MGCAGRDDNIPRCVGAVRCSEIGAETSGRDGPCAETTTKAHTSRAIPQKNFYTCPHSRFESGCGPSGAKGFRRTINFKVGSRVFLQLATPYLFNVFDLICGFVSWKVRLEREAGFGVGVPRCIVVCGDGVDSLV